MTMISAEQVTNRAGDEGVMPLLTLDEFFDGNDNEGCIAPNQWGYGRPALAELAERFRAIEGREDVAWVRVQLHPETLEMDELAGRPSPSAPRRTRVPALRGSMGSRPAV
ncbi:hypothetical protein ABT247_01300 [Kitasatospora sp. NPDC001539]|uniref:hypothetical protein n=1 Tax=Kitasatospora sp. NPDC001539 TaxID=3154384 RepID=UPI00332247A3